VRPAASPAAAIGWEFRRHHRWGFLALGGYLVLLGAIKLIFLARGQAVSYASDESFALWVVVPLGSTVTYCLAVFSYGLSGDLAGRPSTYPSRMFALPVSNAALAGWPMLFGTLAIAILWAATRLLVAWPSGIDVPVLWPAVLGAALLAWTQALTWMPYGLPGARVVVAVLCLATIDSVVLLALRFQAREPVMLAIAAPQVPLAYLAAWFAVARARRGVVPDWRGAFTWPGRIIRFPGGRVAAFATPARAQAWFEWRRHGWSLPALVGLVLPFELAVLWLAVNAPVLVFTILLCVLLTPPFMAGFVAATVRKPDAGSRDGYGLTPFLATRPLSSLSLIAAKLRMTIWSTLAAWLLVLVAAPLALSWSKTWPVVLDRWHRTVQVMGAQRAAVLLLLIVLGCMASTWKQLVQTLYLGLTGRDWAVKGWTFLTLLVLSLLGPVLDFLGGSPAVRAALWDAAPWILAALVSLKLSAAAWIAVRLYHSRLLSDRTLVIGAACWCVAVLALYGVLVWWLSSEFFPRYLFALLAILGVPLARLSLAPLALAWNRHR
jgi:hypothetical protein